MEAYPESKYLAEAKELKEDSEAGIANAKKIIAARAADYEKYQKELAKEAKRDSIDRIITPIK